MQHKPLLVGWKVSALSAKMASVRYRALLPMLALEGAGVKGRVFSEGHSGFLDGLDALVIVKSFSSDDILLAKLAHARGVKVYFDLCDNIFIDGYGGHRVGLSPAAVLQRMASCLEAIVVPTEPLADRVRQHVPRANVVVIPDGIEAPGFVSRMRQALAEAAVREAKGRGRRFWKRRLRDAMHRVRDEGVVVLPSMVRSAARQLSGAVLRRVESRLHRAHSPDAAVAHVEEARPLADGPARIVWFGNHGAEHGRFGMLDLLEWREPLEALAAEREVELVVISNHREKYEQNIRPLRIRSRYVEWSPAAVEAWLEGASAVLIPNSLDAFSICKSANRSVLALGRGLPVVATMTPALQPLADFVEAGNPLDALRRVLADLAAARARAAEGRRHAEALFGAQAVQAQWLGLIGTGRPAPAPVREPFLAVLLHLVQDLDLALPILKEAREAGISCQAWCTTELLRRSPRVLVTLEGEGIEFRALPDEEALGGFKFPRQTRAFLTVAETSLGPHRIPRMLTEAAIRQDRFTATLQHGFENVGLTYEDDVHPLDKVSIAARRIYTWGPLETLHPRSGARERCVPVGCPKDARVPAADLGSLLPGDRPTVGVFENLHWHRYSDAYRASFLESVQHVARSFPQLWFLVKPHHAGMWLSHRYQGALPDAGNLVIADPKSREWEQHTAPALLPHLAAAITTPSTVALDAARQGLPAAVFAGELGLDNYLPLPLLREPADWTDFISQALDPAHRPGLQVASEGFVKRVLVPGHAARRIVEDLRASAAA